MNNNKSYQIDGASRSKDPGQKAPLEPPGILSPHHEAERLSRHEILRVPEN